MSEFAEFDASGRQRRLAVGDGLTIRPSRESDLPELAAIAAEREGEPVAGWLHTFSRVDVESRTGRSLLLVAVLDSVVQGYGKAAYHVPPAGSPVNAVPEGWYLTGVVVRPAFRRRGVGSLLTQERMTWIACRSTHVYYVANERNQVSIELHRRLGFVELTRDFVHPQVKFQGGRGILFVCDLRR